MKDSSRPSEGRCGAVFAKILVGAAIAIVALFFVLQFALGPIVKHGAAAAGPAALGVPVSIEKSHVRIFSGLVDFGGVVIGAPEGFDASLFELGSFRAEVSPASLFGGEDEPIEILDISIREPFVTYELKGLKSNLQALLDKLGGGEEKPDEPEKKQGRRVVIRHFLFEGAKVRVAVAGGKGAVVPLPTIELRDIGAKSGGVTGVEAFAQILKSITVGTVKAVVGVVADVGGVAVDAAGAVADAAKDAAKAAVGNAAEGAKDAAKAAVGAIGSLLGSGGKGE